MASSSWVHSSPTAPRRISDFFVGKNAAWDFLLIFNKFLSSNCGLRLILSLFRCFELSIVCPQLNFCQFLRSVNSIWFRCQVRLYISNFKRCKFQIYVRNRVCLKSESKWSHTGFLVEFRCDCNFEINFSSQPLKSNMWSRAVSPDSPWLSCYRFWSKMPTWLRVTVEFLSISSLCEFIWFRCQVRLYISNFKLCKFQIYVRNRVCLKSESKWSHIGFLVQFRCDCHFEINFSSEPLKSNMWSCAVSPDSPWLSCYRFLAEKADLASSDLKLKFHAFCFFLLFRWSNQKSVFVSLYLRPIFVFRVLLPSVNSLLPHFVRPWSQNAA